MTNEVNNVLSIVEDVGKSVVNAGPEALTVVGVVALGYALRAVKLPKKFVPIALFVLGPLLYAFISSPGDSPENMRSPIMHQVVIGLILTAVAWGAHELVVKRAERWFKNKFGSNGDTEINVREKG